MFSNASRLGSEAKYGSRAKGSEDDPELMDDDDDVAMEAPMDVAMDDEPPVDVDMVDDDPEDPVLQGTPPHTLITVPRIAAQSGSARHCASSTAHVVGSKHTR